MNDALVKKLSAILRKTVENGCTEAEARAACEAAQRIAIQNNLDLSEVSRKAREDGKAPTFETDAVKVRSKRAELRRPHHGYIVDLLMEVFGVRFVFHGKSSRMTIIGEKTDAALAAALWDYLDPLFPRLLSAYLKRPFSMDTADHRDGFYLGLAAGIYYANRRIREAAPMQAAAGQSYALVVADKDAAVSAKMEELFPGIPKTRERKKKRNEYALRHGIHEGRKIRFDSQLEPASAAT